MDDSKGHIKSVVAVYLNRRQLSFVKPRIISKRTVLKQTSLRTRISRTAMNSFVNYCDDDQDEDDQLLVEYSFMFQKFMHWLKEQTDQKHRCYDIEKIVGPLFCHLYMDIRHNNKRHEESSNLFFKTHIDKIDRTKCDAKIQSILNAIETTLDNMVVVNGTDALGSEDLREKLLFTKSTKIVIHLKSESLKLLKKFIAYNSKTESHVVLLQALQSWFDFKELPGNENGNNCTEDISKKFKKPVLKQGPSHYRTMENCVNYCDNSQGEDDQEDDDQLLVEYSFMFQKFLHWLKEQTDQKQMCHDIERIVGPLFCHLYLDMQHTNRNYSSSHLFFRTHIHKIDRSKCDTEIQEILKATETTLDNMMVQNGREGLGCKDLHSTFRSTKTVIYLEPESLELLTEFMAYNSQTAYQVVFLQGLQSWFDFQVKRKVEIPSNCKEDTVQKLGEHAKQNDRVVKVETDDTEGTGDMKVENHKLTPQKSEIRSVIKKVRKLPASVCNVRILNNKHFVSCGIIRSNAGLLAFVERNILRVMPMQTLVDHVRFVHHSKQIYCIALCSNNDIVCTGSADRSICVYSLRKFKLLRRLFGHLGPVYSVAISQNSKYLASGSHDGTARLWSLRSGKVLRIFAGHSEAVMSVNFHPNSLYLATGSADRNIRVWCLNTAKTVRLLHAAKKEIYCVVFSPNGQYLASSDDKRVKIYNLANSKIFHEFKNRESVFQLIWSKNGKQLCGGTASGVVKIWDVREKDKDHARDHKHSHSDYVLRRHTNGRLLALDYTVGTWICLSTPIQPSINT